MEAHNIPPEVSTESTQNPPVVAGSRGMLSYINGHKKTFMRICGALVIIIILVLGYLFLGSEAIVRRGMIGLGERQVLKTAGGHVGQKKYDAIIAGLKYYGYKDSADSKNGLPSARDGAQKMLATLGYLEKAASKNKLVLSSDALDTQLKQRYGSKTKAAFYQQYKNPEQMAIYIETEAKLQVYKTMLQTKLLKGKQATVITVRIAGVSTSSGRFNEQQVQTILTAIKKDVQNNFRPLLGNKSTLESVQAGVVNKKVNTGGIAVVPAPSAMATSTFYPAVGATGDTAIAKLTKNVVTVSSLVGELKVGEISPVTELTFGTLVVVRYDADLSSNPYKVWTDLTPVAVKESKFY